LPAIRAKIVLVTCATPGSGLPVLSFCGRCVADHEDFRIAGEREVGSDDHPAGAVLARVEPFCSWRRRDAGSPDDVRSVMRSLPIMTSWASREETGVPRRTSTLRRSSALLARADSFSGKLGSRREPASTRIIRACLGSMFRKSLLRAFFASSAMAPIVIFGIGF